MQSFKIIFPHKLNDFIGLISFWKKILITALCFLSGVAYFYPHDLFMYSYNYSVLSISFFTMHVLYLFLFKRRVLLKEAVTFTVIMQIYICFYALFVFLLHKIFPELFIGSYHFGISNFIGALILAFPLYLASLNIAFFKCKHNISVWKGAVLWFLIFSIFLYFVRILLIL